MPLETIMQAIINGSLTRSGLMTKHQLPVHSHGQVQSVYQGAYARSPENALWHNTRTFSSLIKAQPHHSYSQ